MGSRGSTVSTTGEQAADAFAGEGGDGDDGRGWVAGDDALLHRFDAAVEGRGAIDFIQHQDLRDFARRRFRRAP